MRNDNLKWQPSNTSPTPVAVGETQLICIDGLQQTLISGPRQAALALAQVNQASGWPDTTEGDYFALSMRRDRILLVGACQLQQGWITEHGLAVSDVSGQYKVIEIKGPQAFSLLCQGTELNINQASASAARIWHGYGVLLYRHQQQDCFRLHVARAHFDALWQLLSAILQDNN